MFEFVPIERRFSVFRGGQPFGLDPRTFGGLFKCPTELCANPHEFGGDTGKQCIVGGHFLRGRNAKTLSRISPTGRSGGASGPLQLNSGQRHGPGGWLIIEAMKKRQPSGA